MSNTNKKKIQETAETMLESASVKAKKMTVSASEQARKMTASASEQAKKMSASASKTAHQVASNIEKAAEKAAREAEKNVLKKYAGVVWVQSTEGKSVTLFEVMERIEKANGGADAVYIKPEDNKAYYVKDGQTGSVSLW